MYHFHDETDGSMMTVPAYDAKHVYTMRRRNGRLMRVWKITVPSWGHWITDPDTHFGYVE